MGWAMFQGIFRFPYLKNNGWYEVDAPERSRSDYQDKAPCEQQTRNGNKDHQDLPGKCVCNMEKWRTEDSHINLMQS